MEKDSIEKVIKEILKDEFKDFFKEYYLSDPIVFPRNSLPACIIEVQSQTDTVEVTGHDTVTTVLQIRIVVDKRNDFNKKGNQVLWRQRLREMVEARDGTTGRYKDNSVKGVLRKNYTLGNRTIDMNTTTEYGIVPRENIPTEEARVTLTVEELVEIQSRS